MIASVSSLAQQSLPQGGWAILVLVLVIGLGYVAALFWSALGQGAATSTEKPMSLSVDPQKRTVVPVTSSRSTKKVVQPVVSEKVVASPAVEPPTKVEPIPAEAAAPALDAEVSPIPAVEPVTVVAEEPEILVAEVIEEPAVFIATDTEDDLKRIEGIGPKIASVLAGAGITSFGQLAQMEPDQIRAVLAGQVRLVNPQSWPAQAQLAAEGKWDELTEMQSQLKVARRA